MEVRTPSVPLNLQLQLDQLTTLLTPLPEPQTKVGAAVTPVTSPGFTPLAGIGTISVDVPRDTWVTVTAGAWMQGTSGDVRAGVALSGATTVDVQNDPAGAGAWGAVLWSTGSYRQCFSVRELKINAGVTIFTLSALLISGSGSGSVNYPIFTVTPRRWVDLDPLAVEPEE